MGSVLSKQCKTSPCQNDGACYHYGDPSETRCVCPPPFYGSLCNIKVSSCADAKTKISGAPGGLYAIDPDGNGPLNFHWIHCDMTSVGGGWSMCYTTDDKVQLNSDTTTIQYGVDGYKSDCTHISVRVYEPNYTKLVFAFVTNPPSSHEYWTESRLCVVKSKMASRDITLGTRVLHAPHPDGLLKAGKNKRTAWSEQSERSAGREWPLVPTAIFESKFDSGNWARDAIPGQTGFTYVTRDHELFDILGDVSSKRITKSKCRTMWMLLKFFFSKLRVT